MPKLKKFAIFLASTFFLGCSLSGTSTAPENLAAADPVTIELLGAGMDGYCNDDLPCVVRYRIENPGSARALTLKLFEVETVAGAFAPLKTYPGSRKDVRLEAGSTSEGDLVLPSACHSWKPNSAVAVAAVDGSGRIAGWAKLPEPKSSSVIAVIASDQRIAKTIGNALQWQQENFITGEYRQRPEIAVLSGRLPDLWYGYLPAGAVVIGRQWESLSGAEKLALRRWVSFGGTLIVIAEACEDWRNMAQNPVQAAGLKGARFGNGRIFVYEAASPHERGETGINEESLRAWLNSAGLFNLDSYSNNKVRLNLSGQGGVFRKSYSMPDTITLVLLIIGIIVLVGPVTHIGLARLKRREAAWIAVPCLSLILGLFSYAMASRAKGEGSAIEVRHIVRSFEDAVDAMVLTSARLLSSEAGLASLAIAGTQPEPARTYHRYLMPSDGAPEVSITPEGVAISRILARKWSIKDFQFVSVSDGIPLELRKDGDRIFLRNTGTAALKDLFVQAGGRWLALGPALDPGGEIEGNLLDAVLQPSELKPQWEVEGGKENLEKELSAIMNWQQNPGYEIKVIAKCDPGKLPYAAVEPRPRESIEDATCIWHFWRD